MRENGYYWVLVDWGTPAEWMIAEWFSGGWVLCGYAIHHDDFMARKDADFAEIGERLIPPPVPPSEKRPSDCPQCGQLLIGRVVNRRLADVRCEGCGYTHVYSDGEGLNVRPAVQ